MEAKEIPVSRCAIIGGSSTFSLKFPEALGETDIEVIERGCVFDTPFGESPPFTFFRAAGEGVLTCKMHGWRVGVPRAKASQQVFWVLQQAQARMILSEGGVGSIRETMNPRDLVVPHDYIDFSQRRDVGLGGEYLLIMRNPLCPTLRRSLIDAAKEEAGGTLYESGICVVTDGRHFESRAEIGVMRNWGADVVGQSLCPEVYLAREIGACYAGVYLVVNFAEGIKGDWDYREFKDIFFTEAKAVGFILLKALKSAMARPQTCECARLRKPTLLKEG
jgi:5'-methylthioadenosine phosphorylase